MAADWLTRRPFRLWREFTDRQQLALIGRWLRLVPPANGDQALALVRTRLLKTDLFDEVAGRGLVPRLLASGLNVTGIDISPIVVKEAASRNTALNAVVADVRSMPFPDHSFDAVYSGSTLDHFESADDIRKALVEIRRVLRPGGQLLLTLDNPANPILGLRNGPLLPLLRRIHVVPYHVGATLGPKALPLMLSVSGFGVLESTTVMHCPRAAAVACAGLVDRLLPSHGERFIKFLDAWEVLGRLPTRLISGYYIAVRAVAHDPTGEPSSNLPSAGRASAA